MKMTAIMAILVVGRMVYFKGNVMKNSRSSDIKSRLSVFVVMHSAMMNSRNLHRGTYIDSLTMKNIVRRVLTG